jgi:DNA-binding response OmpR family regulator
MNIGLLEDNQAVSECIAVVLGIAGHRVSKHTTGASLLGSLAPGNRARQVPYDLLIIDLNLPGELSGQDVIAKVRATSTMNDMPILIITGMYERELAHVKERFPSIPILRKPFKMQALAHFVDQYYALL